MNFGLNFFGFTVRAGIYQTSSVIAGLCSVVGLSSLYMHVGQHNMVSNLQLLF